VTVLKQGFNVDPLLQKQAACISTMTYNEYWQVIDAGIKPEELVTFKYQDMGVATLEDGLYVLEDKLADPAFQATMVKFVRASMKGWKYAEANPDEAAMIVLDNDQTGAQTEVHQKRMMGEVAKLTAGSNGALDVAAAEKTVATLMAGGSDPVITKAPEGAWTSIITDEALK
jgi:NitT/TauT family transport system substrate-binding protein